MAKVSAVSVDGDKKKGYTVSVMLEDGAFVDIKEGFEFVTKEEHDALVTDMNSLVESRDAMANDLTASQDAYNKAVVEIGELRRQLLEKPVDVRTPMLHVEHQDIPTGRTLDKLAPVSALAAAPTLDEPAAPAAVDPEAPARPPGPNEMVAHRGEYQGGGYFPVDDEGRPSD